MSGLRYRAEDIDRMIGHTVKHRQALVNSGHVDHFGRAVVPPAPKDGKPVEAPTHDGYCMKCKAPKKVVTEGVVSGPAADRVHGKCPTCGTSVHRFMKKSESAKISAALSTLSQTGGVV